MQLVILDSLFSQVRFQSLNMCGSVLYFLLREFELRLQVHAISRRLIEPVLSAVELLCQISKCLGVLLLQVTDLVSVTLKHLLTLLTR